MKQGLVLQMLVGLAGLPAVAAAGTWVAYNPGLKNLTVVGIGISPSNPNTLYPSEFTRDL